MVVAAADLAVGAELTADSLRTIDWPPAPCRMGRWTIPKKVVARAHPAGHQERADSSDEARVERGRIGPSPRFARAARGVGASQRGDGVAGYVLPGLA